jgi:hypothetical protein
MAKVAKNRELNLLLALDRSKVRTSGGSGAKLIILLIIIVILAFAAAAVFYFMETSELEDQKNTSEVYLNDPTVQAAYDESNRAQAQAMQMQAESSELVSAIANLKTYPDIRSSQWKKLFRIAGGRVTLSGFAYDRTTGLLTFAATTESGPTRIPIFIAELRTSKIFSDVTYEGYAGSTTPATPPEYEMIIDPETGLEEQGPPIPGTGAPESRTYAFNVSCLVKPPAAEAEK